MISQIWIVKKLHAPDFFTVRVIHDLFHNAYRGSKMRNLPPISAPPPTTWYIVDLNVKLTQKFTQGMLSCPYQPIKCFLFCTTLFFKNVLSLAAKRMAVVWELIIAQNIITCLLYLLLLCSTVDSKCCLWNQTWINCNGVKIREWLCLSCESFPFFLVIY